MIDQTICYECEAVAMRKDIEDRIFELNGELIVGHKVVDAVVEEYGIDRKTAWDLYVKVRTGRGSPSRVATKEAIARLGRIRFI
jgi:hypothetical protein